MRNWWALGFVCTYIQPCKVQWLYIYYPSMCVGSGCCDAAD